MSRAPFTPPYAPLTGIILGSFFVLWSFSPRIHLSRKKAYDAVYVGMAREEAAKALAERSVECALTEPAERCNVCHFSDPWRLYLIAVDSQTGRVARKDMLSLGPLSLNDTIKSRHSR